MYRRLVWLCCPLLLAFAPVPPVRPAADPDRAIQLFVKEINGPDGRADERKRRLVERLDELRRRLERSGRAAEADVVADLLVLAGNLEAGQQPLGDERPAVLVRRAAVDGKYRRLLHVIHVPADRDSYSSFKDFGYWNGGSYGGQDNLRSGYWVYVYPRWFIWRDGPSVQP